MLLITYFNAYESLRWLLQWNAQNLHWHQRWCGHVKHLKSMASTAMSSIWFWVSWSSEIQVFVIFRYQRTIRADYVYQPMQILNCLNPSSRWTLLIIIYYYRLSKHCIVNQDYNKTHLWRAYVFPLLSHIRIHSYSVSNCNGGQCNHIDIIWRDSTSARCLILFFYFWQS